MVTGGIVQGAPVLTALFYLVIVGWITAVEKLAYMFDHHDKAQAAKAAKAADATTAAHK